MKLDEVVRELAMVRETIVGLTERVEALAGLETTVSQLVDASGAAAGQETPQDDAGRVVDAEYVEDEESGGE